MTFVEAVKSVFTKYATFSGRARRSEYWYFFLFNCIVSALIGAIGAAIGGEGSANPLSSIWSLAVLIPTLAVSWRRLHDIGKAGGFWFLNFIPLVGQIILLVWFCKDSQPEDNQYGPNPKAAAPTEEV
ncbi:MAG: DUF805 domain-containing protein [Oscillospiraceae bacterium]|nr:DUF805 domain-containing protein [Oscillospiraceae bacterium]